MACARSSSAARVASSNVARNAARAEASRLNEASVSLAIAVRLNRPRGWSRTQSALAKSASSSWSRRSPAGPRRQLLGKSHPVE